MSYRVNRKQNIWISRECFSLIEKNIWRSPILTDSKVHLYRTYILLVSLYGCETWTVSKTLAKRLDAFDTWCLRKILRIPYTRHTTNDTVRSTTGALPVSEKVKSFRLRFFGSISFRGGPSPCHRRRAATTIWLAETCWSSKIHLAERDWRGRSAPELWGPHGMAFLAPPSHSLRRQSINQSINPGFLKWPK